MTIWKVRIKIGQTGFRGKTRNSWMRNACTEKTYSELKMHLKKDLIMIGQGYRLNISQYDEFYRGYVNPIIKKRNYKWN